MYNVHLRGVLGPPARTVPLPPELRTRPKYVAGGPGAGGGEDLDAAGRGWRLLQLPLLLEQGEEGQEAAGGGGGGRSRSSPVRVIATQVRVCVSVCVC